jgi:hypothetical protein
MLFKNVIRRKKNNVNFKYFLFGAFFSRFLLITVGAFSKAGINKFEISFCICDTHIYNIVKKRVIVALFGNFESKHSAKS